MKELFFQLAINIWPLEELVLFLHAISKSAKPAFQTPPLLKSVFKKLRFSDGYCGPNRRLNKAAFSKFI